MSPRRRKPENRDLPDNLQYSPRVRGGNVVKYYYYLHPVTGLPTGFGYDKAEAIAAARQLNEVLGRGRALADKVMRGQKRAATLGEFIARFETEILPARRVKGQALSPFYIAETIRILAVFARSMGEATPVAAITQAQIAAYLNSQSTAEAYNQHRKRLVVLWRHMVSDGLVEANLPERIIKRDRPPRVRSRLTLEAYRAIYRAAPRAVRMAMELSLNSLQRRADIQKWRFDDQREGYAWVVQQKTKKHGPSAYLRIPLAMPVAHSEAGCRTLGDLIDACRDDVICPYLVHHRPQRVRKSKEKLHPFQLSRAEISNGFAEARDACGLFDAVSPEQRPSFHELMALGQHLRKQQGWTVKQIQALRGHTSERMTQHYLEGHEWTTVEIPKGGAR